MTLHQKTPTLFSHPLTQITKRDIYLKMECDQPSGSFKIRGIGQLCESLAKKGTKHFVCRSGGNAGYATAYAGRQLQKKVTVVCFEGTPQVVIDAAETLEAKVVVHGSDPDTADEFARKLCEDESTAYISPNNHPEIWSGHSTLIDEAAEQMGRPDLVICSVGGGGLLCGLIEGLHRHSWSDVPVLAVETQGADSLAQAIQNQQRVTLPQITSVAKTLGEMTIIEKAFEWTQKHSVTSLVVDDKAAINACWQFANDQRRLVEPACGAALSAVYDAVDQLGDAQKILVIVCGGIGVSLEQLNNWKSQYDKDPQ